MTSTMLALGQLSSWWIVIAALAGGIFGGVISPMVHKQFFKLINGDEK